MGYIVKNTTQDNDANNLGIGNNVYIPKTKEKGIIVLKLVIFIKLKQKMEK